MSLKVALSREVPKPRRVGGTTGGPRFSPFKVQDVFLLCPANVDCPMRVRERAILNSVCRELMDGKRHVLRILGAQLHCFPADLNPRCIRLQSQTNNVVQADT